ncbi:hypothetical protein CR513_19347, partial [Mucuna pruriens]
MEHNMMKVYDNKRKLILKVPLSKNRTFKIGIQIGESHCLTTTKRMVYSLPSIEPPNELCKGCLISKLTRSSFKSNIPTTKALLEVVCLDVCGPMESVSLGGNHYFIFFVDDFSRKKGETFEVFKRFKEIVEKQCGESIKILRTNDDGEYTSHDFHSYYDKEGIIHEVTAPYTLQHNGKDERRNRTLMNITRCMLKDKNMPK